MTTVFVPNSDLDSIMRITLNRLEKTGRFKVTIAGPGEIMEAPEIKSKLHLKAVRSYRQLLKQTRPDIIFSVSTSALSVMLMASIGLGIRNVGYRGTQARVKKSDIFNYLALLNPRVSHVICETSDIAETLGKQIGKNKVSVATKPYHLEWADDAINNPVPYPGKNGSALKLITIGMFDGRPHKGLGVLLEAMQKLSDHPIELTVVGSASREDVSQAPDSVTFVGQRKDAINLLPAHDLYVLPSLRDASPRTLREAQAVGLPCIVSDIPGARDLIIPGETGMLFPPGDSGRLAKILVNLSADRTEIERWSRNTRPHIRDHFRMDNFINYHANLFESLK